MGHIIKRRRAVHILEMPVQVGKIREAALGNGLIYIPAVLDQMFGALHFAVQIILIRRQPVFALK